MHAFHTMRVAAAARLAPGDEAAVADAASRIQAFTQTTVDAFATLGEVACDKGCTYCCHISVAASLPEVLPRHTSWSGTAMPSILPLRRSVMRWWLSGE